MGPINGQIVVSVIILMAAGVYRVLVVRSATKAPNDKQSATITRVLVGGYMLAIVASIIDLVGGPASAVSGLLVGLAAFTALYAVLPDLFQRFSSRGTLTETVSKVKSAEGA